MPAISVEIKNIDKIRAAFIKAPQISAKHFKPAIEKSLRLIQREAIRLAPHKFGELERSLGRGIEFNPLHGRVYSDLKYALYQHEGLTLQHPRKGEAKFLEKGVTKSLPDIQKVMALALERTLDEIAKSSN